MNIDEVLLTEGEICRARNQFTLDYKRAIAQNKAQCLKLLEWLKEPCKHCPKSRTVEMDKGCSATVFYNRAIDCSECMPELESKLKEGR